MKFSYKKAQKQFPCADFLVDQDAFRNIGLLAGPAEKVKYELQTNSLARCPGFLAILPRRGFR